MLPLDTLNHNAICSTLAGSSVSVKVTDVVFHSVEDAERYAVELTDRAITAISDYDKDGSLTSLAYYLCNRTY